MAADCQGEGAALSTNECCECKENVDPTTASVPAAAAAAGAAGGDRQLKSSVLASSRLAHKPLARSSVGSKVN